MDADAWDENEPLIDGLEALPPGAFHPPVPPDGLREALWARTAAALHARARGRRAASLGLLLVAYAAGLGSVHLFPRRAPESAPPAAETRIRAPEPGPRELERLAAEAAPAERPRLLKLAGDRYLAERGDVEGAFACYRRLLRAASPERRLEIDAEDSWLLALLKRARQARGSGGNPGG